MELDHIVVAVSDLATAGREFEARYGLASVDGGSHPGWGTANRIVPLGDTYLELVAVVDAAAVRSPFGRWIADADPKPLLRGWAVRTDGLDEVAARLELAIGAGSRATADGLLRWRAAGIEAAVAEPSLPFFIEWSADTVLPGGASVAHPAGDVVLAEVRLTGDVERVADWLGAHDLPIVVRPGPPALTGIVLTHDGRDIVLGRAP